MVPRVLTTASMLFCSGQILTFVKIMTCIWILGGSTSLPVWDQLTYKSDEGTKRKPWVSPWTHIRSEITQLNLSSSPGRQQSIHDQVLSGQKSFPEPPRAPTWRPSGACYSRITYSWIVWSPWSDYTARSSSHFKHYKAPITAQAVINSDRYLYMAILQSSDMIWVVTKRL